MGNETQITQKMTVGVTGTTGILTLTRPKALNALDLAMYHLIDDALTAWEDEPAISQVLIVSGIDRAFCAGGDIRIITEGIDAATAQYATTPSSLVATAELYRANAAAATVEEGLHNEWEMGATLRREPNFPEGVRAVLVDKDRNAAFVPATTDEVDPTPYQDAVR